MIEEGFWIKQFQQRGALWIYQGEPSEDRPHGLMTSGKHSNGFFNGSLVIRDTKLMPLACASLFDLSNLDQTNINSVWGSAMGGITIAYEIARHIGVPAGFTEKDGDTMVAKRFPIEAGERVLVTEDVMTTGGTTQKTIFALENAGAIVLDEIFVLVNRSGQTELDGRKIVALINRELPLWNEADCPYCQAGSKALRPKGNWKQLTGQTE